MNKSCCSEKKKKEKKNWFLQDWKGLPPPWKTKNIIQNSFPVFSRCTIEYYCYLVSNAPALKIFKFSEFTEQIPVFSNTYNGRRERERERESECVWLILLLRMLFALLIKICATCICFVILDPFEFRTSTSTPRLSFDDSLAHSIPRDIPESPAEPPATDY